MSQNDQPINAMDSLLQASKVNIIPNQEYLLRGSILDTHVQQLLHILKGLCDNVETAPEQFNDHEACFSLSNMSDKPEMYSVPLLLRVRRSNDPSDNRTIQLRYVGNPELGDNKRPTLVRSCFDISCSPSIVEFLTEMGCRLEFEYAVRGYLFRKGRMKITVSKIFKPISLEPLSGSYLVELSLLAPQGGDSLAEDMKSFAEKLKPLVILEQINYRRAPMM